MEYKKTRKVISKKLSERPEYWERFIYEDSEEVIGEIYQWHLEDQPEIVKFDAIIYDNGGCVAQKEFHCIKCARKEIIEALELEEAN